MQTQSQDPTSSAFLPLLAGLPAVDDGFANSPAGKGTPSLQASATTPHLPDSLPISGAPAAQVWSAAEADAPEGADGAERLLEALVVLAEAQRPGRSGHGRRVAGLAFHLAVAGGLDQAEAMQISRAACFMDIGMATVPLTVATKQGTLTDGERESICRHPSAGAALLSRLETSWSVLAARMALSHHEWWNGAGYPNGLMGSSIPLEARIVAVCDVFLALLGGGGSRDPISVEEALEVIRMGAGSQFDPHLAGLFVALIRQDQIVAFRSPD